MVLQQPASHSAVRQFVDALNPAANPILRVRIFRKTLQRSRSHLNGPAGLSQYVRALVVDQADGVLSP